MISARVARAARAAVVSVLALGMTAVHSNAIPSATMPAEAPASGRILVVRAQPGRLNDVEALAVASGFRVVSSIAPLEVLRVEASPNASDLGMRALATSPLVTWIDRPHNEFAERIIPDDTYYANFQWNLARIGMENAWSVTTGRANIVVAILDTGIDLHHPDLAPNLLAGYDFVNDDPDPSDDSSHGTAVAGIVAAVGNNGFGVAGVAWQVKLLPVKVLDAQGQGSDDIVAEGVVYAVDKGARVINISSSTVDESKVLRDAIGYANSKGSLVVAAAGNTGDRANRPNYPAAYPGVLAVGATDKSDKVPIFSQRQPYVGMAAPGIDVPSTAWSGAGLGPYALTTGTSAAAPQVSGVAALLLSVRPDLTVDQLRDALEDSAQDVCPPGRDDASGFGRLDAAQALASVLGRPSLAPSPTAAADATPPPTAPELPALPTIGALAPVPTAAPVQASSPVAAPIPSSWYFAEGSTQPPFETWLALFNPNPRAADVRITYMSKGGAPLVVGSSRVDLQACKLEYSIVSPK